jgi:hypothetical protein
MSGGAKVRAQISPGAELSRFFDDVIEMDRRIGIDIVFDRCPYVEDFRLIQALIAQGRSVRWVFVPKREIDVAREIARIPDHVRSEMYLFFPESSGAGDLILSADEIFLLMSKLTQRFPELVRRVLNYDVPLMCDQMRAEERFRSDPTPAVYRESFLGLGGARFFRLFIYGFCALFFPLKIVSMRAYWLARKAASQSYWKSYRGTTQAWGNARGEAVRLFWAVRSLFDRLIRDNFIRAYWIFRGLCTRVYWSAAAFFRSPIWWVRLRAPFVYWALIFPLFKSYWFIRYQASKRLGL